MPRFTWSDRRERHYKYIRASASRSSTQDLPSGRRGGLRSHTGPRGRTREQLYNEAKQQNVKDRSKMTKAQLERAVDR
jgi:hypothetical protein